MTGACTQIVQTQSVDEDNNALRDLGQREGVLKTGNGIKRAAQHLT